MTPEDALADLERLLEKVDRLGFERGSPTYAAETFVQAVINDNPLVVWTLLDDQIQAEILADLDVTASADSLPSLELWPDVARVLIQAAHLWLRWAFDLEVPGWATDPRPEALDMEAVLLVDASTPAREGAPATRFLMRRVDDGWRIAGIDTPDEACTAQ